MALARQRHDPGDLGRPQATLSRMRLESESWRWPRTFGKLGQGHGLLPREIASLAAFDNAMVLDMAMGGQHQHRPAHPGHRARGRRPVHARPDQRAFATRRPTSARSRRRAVTTSKTWLGPAEFTRSSARSPEASLACSTWLARTVTGKTLGENIAEFDIRSQSANSSRPGPREGSVPAASGPPGPGPCRASMSTRDPRSSGVALLEAEGEDEPPIIEGQRPLRRLRSLRRDPPLRPGLFPTKGGLSILKGQPRPGWRSGEDGGGRRRK